MADILEDIWDCANGATLINAVIGRYDFPCGLIVSRTICLRMSRHEAGILNSVHQRHHEENHTSEDWVVEFTKVDEGTTTAICRHWNGRKYQ